jgi:V/A-type H+-transporting ATPase subunit D
MSGRPPAATRSELNRLRRRRSKVERGVDLLERKREALIAELFREARPTIEHRERAEKKAAEAWDALLTALPHHGRAEIRAMGWPSRDVPIELEDRSLWGVEVAQLVEPPKLQQSVEARELSPGSVDASVFPAALAFEELTELLLQGLSQDLRLRRLARALERTRRQVNTLRQRVAPEVDRHLREVRETLEEREREDHLRLRHLRGKRQRLH